MNKKLSLRHSFDLIAATIAVVALIGVLQTFVIGKHFIIPTMMLFFCVLFGNLARYGFQGRVWAKQILFWIFFIFTWHAFFALFWAEKYPQILGDFFAYVFGGIVLVCTFLLFRYAQTNDILRGTRGNTP